MGKQKWIKSKYYDSVFILLPPFFCLALIIIFPSYFQTSTLSELAWVILILCVDVGHVYSSIYRIYLDKDMIVKNRFLFFVSPVILYVLGVIIYHLNPLYFWRVLAYFAVYHFAKQQYGFMRLYNQSTSSKYQLLIDKISIYSFTILPIMYWHFSGPQNFNWFVEQDFYYLKNENVLPVIQFFNCLIFLIYVVKEVFISFKEKHFNIGKNGIVLGTAFSWYFGIVYFNGDLTFTLLNVVSHGIPYMALVWAYGNKMIDKTKSQIKLVFKPKYILVFIAIVIGLAYFEELLWDGFIWQDHPMVFPTSKFVADITNYEIGMALLVPLLSLPQIFHYFIDGFIWRIRKDSFGWFNNLFH